MLQKDLNSAHLLGLVLLLGMGLRFYDLGTESYWIDEMATVIEGQQGLKQLLTSGRLDQPPGYYLPFHLWMQIFGSGEATTRLFSAVAGIGSIVIIYLIGQKLFGKSAGLLSAVLMAISGFQIYYSQQTRFYSFYELVVLFSFLFFILAIKTPKTNLFIFYVLASILMVFSHTHGVFIIAAQNIYLALQWKKYRNIMTTWIICQTVILVAFLPYFFSLISGNSSMENAIDFQRSGQQAPPPSSLDPLRSLYRLLMSPRRERSWDSILATYSAAGIFLMVGLWIYAIRRGLENWMVLARELIAAPQKLFNGKSKLLLVGCWLVFPILLPFVISKLIAPIYADRYMIGTAPPLYLLIALGILRIRKVVPIFISLGTLLISIVPGLGYYYTADINEQWREAARYVEANAGLDEVIVFAPNVNGGIQQRSFDWYYQGTFSGCSLESKALDFSAISDSLLHCISGHDRFWVIISDDPTEMSYTYRLFFLDPKRPEMHNVKEKELTFLLIYLFELQNDD